MSIFLFAIIYLSVLSVPGFALNKLVFRQAENSSLIAISISFSAFCLTYLASRNLGLSANLFLLIIAAYVFISAIALIVLRLCLTAGDKKSFRADRLLLTLISISGIYQLTVGAYTEIPADLYTHLERYQSALRQLENNSLGAALTLKEMFNQGSRVFYYFTAHIANALNIAVLDLVEILDFLNRTIFLSAVYLFARQIFTSSRHGDVIAFLASLLLALHMGINVFSFIRYYSLAPVILNIVLFYSSILIFLKILEQPFSKVSIGNHILLIVFALTTSAVHLQETLFSLVMIPCMALSYLISMHFWPARSRDAEAPITRYLILVVGLFAVGFFAAYIYSFLNEVRAPNNDQRLWEFGQPFTFMPAISTLNLKFQFIQTVTLWGLFVYLLFFIRLKRYRSNWFLLAGMFSPLLTILNPFFVDAYLRHQDATTLWRLSYLIPIYFVAADLLLYYLRQAIAGQTWPRMKSLVIVFLILLPLLPFYNTWQGVHYSRVPTLLVSEQSSNLKGYHDLLQYLQNLDQSYQVLTDPVTGYLVSGATKHYNERKKFARSDKFKQFTFLNYENQPLKKYSGHLLIINQRLMNPSEVGILSDHWQRRPWGFRELYFTPTLLDHLSNNPNQFKLLWSKNNIQVFKIEG